MKRLLLGLSLVGVAAAVTVGFIVRGGTTPSASYRFVTVDRGDLASTVSATGTLSAVRTVAVGTQVSGQIAALGADFNDHVRRGQIVALLDSTLLSQAVAQAQTDLDRSRANVEQTRFLSEQADGLRGSGSITDTDYRAAVYNAAVARSALQASQIALARAQQNLRYATIRAPIDGIVIERDVDVGQTVAASLQAPQLFLIAEDLRRMQILASVDESDIGQIAVGQPVRFTVQAYPNRIFEGVVRQVRLQSTTASNVVSYTVVVAVDNDDGALLPGMTATVNFQVAKATNVLRVANAALRFRPSAELAARVQADRAPSGDTSRAAGAPARRANAATLYYLDAAGRPQAAPVRTGLTDGQLTEVTGAALREGMRIIAGLNAAGAAASSTQTATTNPFQQTQQRQGGPRPPGGF
jgi:HlyD family secretion protein